MTNSQPEPVYLEPAFVAKAIGGKVVGGNRVVAHAPGHRKGSAELSILVDPSAPRGILVNCFSGEDPVAMKDWVLRQCGQAEFTPNEKAERTLPTAHLSLVKKDGPKRFYDGHLTREGYSLATSYPYTNPDGEVLFEVCRYEHADRDKTFLQRQPDGKGGWWGGRGDPVLYCWHELAARAGEAVWLCEGEKDVHSLSASGLLATTVPNGSWPEDLSPLKGRMVYVVPDNDAAGAAKATKAIELLQGIATVRRVDIPNLSPKGDVTDWLTAGNTVEQLQALAKSAPPVAANQNTRAVKATPFTLRDPSLIPQREWLWGNHYMRKYLTLTVGAGGGGKSANAVSETLAMVTGRPVFDQQSGLTKKLRVWYVNAEDPADEIERRFTAAAMHFGITADQIGDRLFTDSGRDQEFVILRQEGRDFKVCEPMVEGMLAAIRDNNIDIVIVDPFVSTHEVPENDNGLIQRVAKAWRRVADEGNVGVELIHHVTKGGLEVTADSARGGGALKDAARSVRTINAMTKEEAEKANLPDARGYFRIDFGKANMVASTALSQWRHFASVALGNGKGLVKTGDQIGVVEGWRWPAQSDATAFVTAEVLEAIKRKMVNLTCRENAQSSEWAGYQVAQALGINLADSAEKRRVKRMLDAWKAAGHFTVELQPDYKGNSRPCLVPIFHTSES